MAYQLSVKGVFNRGDMRASVGGVMKKKGQWVRGFGGMIGLADLVTAELWAIFYGLKMAWERQKTSMVLFTESSETIEAIDNPDPSYVMASLVEMINMLRGEAWTQLHIAATPADANHGANAMASLYLAGDGGVDEVEEPPRAINHLI